ncbi:MAG: gliding motility-associated C-terminal domain-containing protein [Bacteroidales bacterium]|nr:gliding motility-associated C-terminal domain-containing protein [Bacteroidales bacterium]
MKPRLLLFFVFLLSILTVTGQYLSNPSFEGPFPLENNPPLPWANCSGSPDTQPLCWDIPTPPSDGQSYVGFAWIPTWIERVWSSLTTPISADTCYLFQIDLSFYHEINHDVGLEKCYPIKIQIYSGNTYCLEGELLWESPFVDHPNWITYEFTLEPDEDIEGLLFRSYSPNPNPPLWPENIGYVLVDNIRITPPPKLELGNDTTICVGDSIVLSAGSMFDEYLWQDGSSDSSIVVNEPGIYWVECITDYGCTVSDTIEINFSPLFEFGNDTTICVGDTLIYNAGSGFAEYLWHDGSTDTAFVVSAPGTYLIWVFVTDNIGCTNSDTVNVTIINDTTDVFLGNDTTICYGEQFQLYPGFYEEFVWQDGSTDTIYIVTAPGDYWVTVFGDCGMGSDTIHIDYYPPIDVNLGQDTAFCEGETLLLDPGGGFIGYLWQDSSMFQTYTVASSGLYWIQVTDDIGCTERDSITVIVDPQPQVNLGNDTAYCEGDPYVLDAGPGYFYTWQNNDTNQYQTVTQTGLYWVLVSNSCGDATDSIFVEVFPQPQPDLGPDTTICSGESLILDPGNQFVSYTWQDNSSMPFYMVMNSGYFSVSVENTYGCFGEDDIFVSLSEPEVDFGEDSFICEGETATLDAGENYMAYLWQDNTTEQIYTVMESGTFWVEVVDEYGCEGGDEINYELYPIPTANLGPDQEVCEGEILLLQGPEGDYIYYWNGVPGPPTYEVTTTGQVTLSVVNPCDSISDQVQILVTPLPKIYLGKDDVLFPGQTIELDAGLGFDEYLWQDGSGGQYFMITENNINVNDPYYYVEVSEGLCKNSDTILIELYQIWVPKVITPNGDGNNDLFRADPERWSGVNQHTIMVFNRWGEKVWESTDFETGWDGKQNGRCVAEGTYFWVLEVYYGSDNVKQVLKGSLTVIGSGN